MTKCPSNITEFHLVGRLLGFVLKKGYKLKYLRVVAAEREYWIKVPKSIRKEIDPAIAPGCWLKITGVKETKGKISKLQLEATKVKKVAKPSNLKNSRFVSLDTTSKSKSQSKAKILICQKSKCWKQGGQKVCQVLEEQLQAQGLEQQVQIKRTGCQKKCKQGPNFVIMPDKAKYSSVKAKEVKKIVEKHFVMA